MRLDRARAFGATEVVDFRQEGFQTIGARASYIKRIVGDRGVNLVIECSGNASAFEEGIGLLARNGTYMLVGTWAGSENVPLCPFDVVQKALRIVGSTYCSRGHGATIGPHSSSRQTISDFPWRPVSRQCTRSRGRKKRWRLWRQGRS